MFELKEIGQLQEGSVETTVLQFWGRYRAYILDTGIVRQPLKETMKSHLEAAPPPPNFGEAIVTEQNNYNST